MPTPQPLEPLPPKQPFVPEARPEVNYVDVFDVIDEDTSFDFNRYSEGERNHLTPALRKAGYQLLGPWRTGDGDSFGPLTREAPATNPEGERVIVCYG